MTDAPFCGGCGAALDDAANYCRSCGARRSSLARWHTLPDHPPPPPPSAAAAGSGGHPWAAVAAGATALVLILGVVVALVLSSRGAGVHAAPPPTVTAVGVGTSSAHPQRSEASSASATRPASGAEVPKAASEDQVFVTYRSKQLTAQVPSGWRMLEDEAQKTGYIESKWLNPAHPSDTVLIDASTATGLSLEQDAAPVHRELQRSAGYEELRYGAGDLAGVASWMWIFRVSGDQRVDYFFNRCALGFGVLGSTVPSRFDRLRATFRAVAESVNSRCG